MFAFNLILSDILTPVQINVVLILESLGTLVRKRLARHRFSLNKRLNISIVKKQVFFRKRYNVDKSDITRGQEGRKMRLNFVKT